MKKLILFIITAVLMLSFSSCAEPPTEAEVDKLVKTLIPASYELNKIYFGEGMPYTEPETSSIYADVTDDAPYMTEAELREATSAVFTENYAENIFRMYLTGYSDDDTGSVIYPRYVESGDRLTIDMQIEPLVTGERTYDLSSYEILKCKAKEVVVEFDTFLDGEPDVKVEVTFRVDEIETDGKIIRDWRIDSPTY